MGERTGVVVGKEQQKNNCPSLYVTLADQKIFSCPKIFFQKILHLRQESSLFGKI